MTAHYPGQVPIDTYGKGGFGFAGMSHRGSILVLPSGIYAWNVDPLNLRPEDFAMVLAERPAIDLLIIGMGKAMARPPRIVRDRLSASGLMTDPMTTGHAVATFNLLLEERRKVAAALLAVDHAA